MVTRVAAPESTWLQKHAEHGRARALRGLSGPRTSRKFTGSNGFRIRALNAEEAQVPLGPAPKKDPYFAAGQRLDRLLSGLGDGEDELLDSMLEEQSTEKKIGLAALAGGLVVGAAVLCCLFLDLDPFGGMRPGLSTATAALTGALVSVPICVFKNALWSEDADTQLPFLKELQRTQINDFKPILSGLNPAQCGAYYCVETYIAVCRDAPPALTVHSLARSSARAGSCVRGDPNDLHSVSGVRGRDHVHAGGIPDQYGGRSQLGSGDTAAPCGSDNCGPAERNLQAH